MQQGNKQMVFWSCFVYEKWNIYIAATSKGLCYVGSRNKPFDELEKWMKKHVPNHSLLQNDTEMKGFIIQFTEYFQGQRTEITAPIDLHGTPFQLSVWEALREIPHGHTFSYSDVATRINNLKAVRAVGAAIGANPLLIAIPCHRVIGKNGTLTGYRGGLEMKEGLLQLERGI